MRRKRRRMKSKKWMAPSSRAVILSAMSLGRPFRNGPKDVNMNICYRLAPIRVDATDLFRLCCIRSDGKQRPFWLCASCFFYRLDRPRYYNSVHLSLSSFIGCTATVTSLSLEHFRSITWNLFLSIGQHLMRWITIIKIHMMSEQLELIGGQFFWWPERTVIFQSLEDVYLKVLSCWFQSEGTFIARGPTGHIIT